MIVHSAGPFAITFRSTCGDVCAPPLAASMAHHVALRRASAICRRRGVLCCAAWSPGIAVTVGFLGAAAAMLCSGAVAASAAAFGDPFALLRVPPSADGLQVRAAFRRLARQYHPDVAESGDSERFRALAWAAAELATTEGRGRWQWQRQVAAQQQASIDWWAAMQRASAERAAARARERACAEAAAWKAAAAKRAAAARAAVAEAAAQADAARRVHARHAAAARAAAKATAERSAAQGTDAVRQAAAARQAAAQAAAAEMWIEEDEDDEDMSEEASEGEAWWWAEPLPSQRSGSTAQRPPAANRQDTRRGPQRVRQGGAARRHRTMRPPRLPDTFADIGWVID
mmetsp:Transcript_93702/g.264463  ORF Transcript_93702/g.264463 Transcript_93702/m.264463 type:complete len:344 (-) Transcript_93702:87-1118(-)